MKTINYIALLLDRNGEIIEYITQILPNEGSEAFLKKYNLISYKGYAKRKEFGAKIQSERKFKEIEISNLDLDSPKQNIVYKEGEVTLKCW